MTFRIPEWKKEWKQGIGENTMPYGYDKVAGPDVVIHYTSANAVETKVLFKYRMKKLFVEWVKLPLQMLRYDVVWTHYDQDTFHIAKLKRIPILKRFLAKCIGQLIWLPDALANMKPEGKKGIAKQLSSIERIAVQVHSCFAILEKELEMQEARLLHIPYGIHLASYHPDKFRVKPAGISEDTVNFVLCVGTDRHRDIALLKQLAVEMPSQPFVLATKNEEFLSDQYPGNIQVMSVSYPEMLWLYAACSSVIVPLVYNEHASGITTVMEAAGMNKPVVVTEVPGMFAYTDKGANAILVPLQDTAAMKNAILKIHAEPEWTVAMVKRANEFMQNYHLDIHFAQGYLDASKQLCEY